MEKQGEGHPAMLSEALLMKAGVVPGNSEGELLHMLHHNRTYMLRGSVKEQHRDKIKVQRCPHKAELRRNGTGQEHGDQDWILLPLFSSLYLPSLPLTKKKNQT